MMIDEQDHIDTSCHLPPGEPIMTPERAAKRDIISRKPCDKCDGNGREAYTNKPCDECRGSGWKGIKNASEIAPENLSEVEYAQAVVRNILNYIWQKNYITQEHYDAAHIFEAWRNQHRVARGERRPTSNDIANPSGVKLRAHGYVLLTQRLRRNDHLAIDNTIEITSNEHTRNLADRNSKLYRGIFDRLCIVLSPIKEQIDYLESLSEEQRDFLSEEKMKIVIATIRNSQ